jgi:hypothetical protein
VLSTPVLLAAVALLRIACHGGSLAAAGGIRAKPKDAARRQAYSVLSYLVL